MPFSLRQSMIIFSSPQKEVYPEFPLSINCPEFPLSINYPEYDTIRYDTIRCSLKETTEGPKIYETTKGGRSTKFWAGNVAQVLGWAVRGSILLSKYTIFAFKRTHFGLESCSWKSLHGISVAQFCCQNTHCLPSK